VNPKMILSGMAFLAALWASWLWFRAGKTTDILRTALLNLPVEPPSDEREAATDILREWIVSMRLEMIDSSGLNQRAALWTALATFLGAMSEIAGQSN
jgi:hypothetical protein